MLGYNIKNLYLASINAEEVGIESGGITLYETIVLIENGKYIDLNNLSRIIDGKTINDDNCIYSVFYKMPLPINEWPLLTNRVSKKKALKLAKKYCDKEENVTYYFC